MVLQTMVALSKSIHDIIVHREVWIIVANLILSLLRHLQINNGVMVKSDSQFAHSSFEESIN
jgi:hypothetical protein